MRVVCAVLGDFWDSSETEFYPNNVHILFSSIFDLELALYYDIPTYSLKNSETTDRYGHIITVGGVGGDFSHTLYSITPYWIITYWYIR